MSDLDDYLKLKSKVDKLKSNLNRLQGSRDTLMGRLATEFKSESLKDAEKKLAKADQAINKLKEDCELGLLQFQENYGKALESIE